MMVLYGLAPYFKDELIKKLESVEFSTISYDESLNKVTRKSQMDILVKYFDEEKRKWSPDTLTAVFLVAQGPMI